MAAIIELEVGARWYMLSAYWMDFVAVIWFFGCWAGYGIYARSRARTRPCLSNSLDLYRRDWMERLLKRDGRIADASVLASLERNGAFFASSSLLVIAGLVTMMGYIEQAHATLQEMRFVTHTTKLALELKLVVLIGVFVYAFFKFTWSMRQYNFCAVMVGSAPLSSEDTVLPAARRAFASSAARVISLAGESFNLGLRSYYYGLCILTWFIHPVLFMLSTGLIVCILYHREFKSRALKALRSGKDFPEMAS